MRTVSTDSAELRLPLKSFAGFGEGGNEVRKLGGSEETIAKRANGRDAAYSLCAAGFAGMTMEARRN